MGRKDCAFRKVLFLLCSFFVTGLMFSFFLADAVTKDVKTDWVAPAKAEKVANPVPVDEKSIALGKKVYTAKCLSCHGVSGKGDGPMHKILKVAPGDLTGTSLNKETDGALFWKIEKGQKPMPSFAKNLTGKERWSVINYIRTLAESGGK